MRLVELLLQQLQQVGVKQIFGIPGDFVLPLFAAIEQADVLPLYYLSHEPAAVFAADGAARISNQPSAVILTYGAGALNAVNAVAQAYVELVPLLIIAGFPAQSEINRKLAIHHQAKQIDSQRDIYREITCAQVRLNDPVTAATELCRAIQTCKRESRPVLLEFPRDATDWLLPSSMVEQALAAAKLFDAPSQQTAFQALANSPQNTPYQQELALATQAVRQRLCQAKQPVLLCGIGVRRFSAVAQVEQLATRLKIPMLTTLLGRSCLDLQHRSYAGVYVDEHDPTQLKMLQDSDLIILLGVIQNDSNFAGHPELLAPEKLLVIGQGELKMPGVIFHDLPIVEVLNQLLQTELPEFSWSQATKDNTVHPQLQAADAVIGHAKSGDSEVQPFNSGAVVTLLDELLSAQTAQVPLVSDIGDCLFASLQAKPSALLAPAFYASMGYAVPAALGVQAASGLRPVVLVGDGAFQMTGLELGHCARYGFAPIVVLLNNGGWQMIKAFAPQLQSTSLHGWNYSAIARGMGGSVHQVWNLAQLATAFSRALEESTRFSLLEVMLPEGSSSCRLQQFADGFLSAQPVAKCTEIAS